jgi:hypothetical protein
MTESVRAPAAAVAEWPDGKELEDGVFIRGAISASHGKGPGAVEEVLGALRDGPGARDGGPGDEEAR